MHLSNCNITKSLINRIMLFAQNLKRFICDKQLFCNCHHIFLIVCEFFIPEFAN